MEFENLVVEKEQNVLFIKLNRPETYNALNEPVGNDLIKALETYKDDSTVRAIVLTGSGKSFCSGGDLKSTSEYVDDDPSYPYGQLTKVLNRLILEIRGMPKPVIAGINGVAAGAGITIAAACDYRVASSAARFRQAYTGVALVPDGAWSLLVPLLIGFGKASELLLIDPAFDAEEARKMGLLNAVVPEEEFHDRVSETAHKISRLPTKSIGIAKEQLNSSMLMMMEKQLEIERQGIIQAARTEDYQEGIRAFLEKRKPNYSGR